MKKLTYTLLAALAIGATACDSKKNTYEGAGHAPTASDSLQVALANQDSLLNLVSDISEGMAQIKQLENILASTGDLTTESKDRRQQIRDDMMAIQQTLQQRRERLAELEKRLNVSDSNNKTLQRTIETLKKQIADQEGTIEGLRGELAQANINIERLTATTDSLNTAVKDVTEAKDMAQEEAVKLTNELNTCYYVVGSNKELKEAKIIEGGFLRKTKVLPEDFQVNAFLKADKRTLTTIPLHSKKGKVMTQQPKNSYQIDEDASGQKILKITDPASFWNKSNYLVIQID